MRPYPENANLWCIYHEMIITMKVVNATNNSNSW